MISAIRAAAIMPSFSPIARNSRRHNTARTIIERAWNKTAAATNSRSTSTILLRISTHSLAISPKR